METKASVKQIINYWEKGGILAVQIYLNETKVFENTWAHKIKTLIENNNIKSVNQEIELVSFNINSKNKL